MCQCRCIMFWASLTSLTAVMPSAEPLQHSPPAAAQSPASPQPTATAASSADDLGGLSVPESALEQVWDFLQLHSTHQ